MSHPYVIGLMGYAGVGKTTTAQILQSIDRDNISIMSFAGPLKEAVQHLFLLSHDQVYGTKEQKETIDERWGKSPREIMQLVGTDCIRNMIDSRFHVKRMDAYLKETKSKVVILDDIRFPDEADLVNFYGSCFNIQRPGYPKESLRHASEYPPIEKALSYYLYNNYDTIYEYSMALLSPQSHIKNLIESKLR